jgi:hypothetical protein
MGDRDGHPSGGGARTVTRTAFQPLADWLEPSLADTAGRDPLGLNTITLDRILPDLIPGDPADLRARAVLFDLPVDAVAVQGAAAGGDGG